VLQLAQQFALGLLTLAAWTALVRAGLAVKACGHQWVARLGGADGELHEFLQWIG